MLKACVAAYLCTMACAHPTLPTMWTAKVSEAQVGVVMESEHFVAKPTPTNPSAKWTNYTDGSCQRLILQTSGYDTTRYLLGCDAVDCCTEDGDGPIEYQIPNVHPAALAPVKSLGKVLIKQFDGSSVETDAWEWKFLLPHYTVYTTGGTAGNVLLHRWNVTVSGEPFVNDYVDFKEIHAAQEQEFLATFQVPAVCQDKSVRSCGGLHEEGTLTDKSVKFLRSPILGAAGKQITVI